MPALILLFLAVSSCIRFPIAQSLQAEASSTPAASVAVYRLENNGADDSTVLVVSDLLFSFIREMRDYNLDFINSTRSEAVLDDSAAEQEAAHDFIFYGRLSTLDDGIRLELFLAGKTPEESRFVSRVYENQNRLMLGTRLLVRELFDSSPVPGMQGVPHVASSAALEPSLTSPRPAEDEASDEEDSGYAFDIEAINLTDVSSIDSLAGSWNGERGIEKIMILRGGRGAAVFSSGFSLMISLSIQNGELIVVQRGNSSPLQFVDLPDPVAEKAAEQAPPIEWRFRISDDGNILAGEKNSVQITHDGQNILSITEKTEQVAWFRN